MVASGELDLAVADRLASKLADEYPEALEIRVDLSRVTFIDGRILGVLVHADQDMRARGGRLVLTGVGQRIRRLLHLTGLDAVLAAERVA
jgi:anti-sigma B factor antagonist